MLPSLTVGGTRLPPRRWIATVAAALLLTAAALTGARGDQTSAPRGGPSLAERLAPSTWAFAVPNAWFAAPVQELRIGDRVDILALRPGERSSANAIAFDLEVMSIDDRVIVLGVGANDATQLAVARASGQLIVPLLRSAR